MTDAAETDWLHKPDAAKRAATAFRKDLLRQGGMSKVRRAEAATAAALAEVRFREEQAARSVARMIARYIREACVSGDSSWLGIDPDDEKEIASLIRRGKSEDEAVEVTAGDAAIGDARQLLEDAGVLYGGASKLAQYVNLNDTFAWALSDCEHVPDEELPRVARLFYRYGFCGVLHWVVERRTARGDRRLARSEFHDINRFIDFARQEERIREEEPSSSARAYLKKQYTIGETDD